MARVRKVVVWQVVAGIGLLSAGLAGAQELSLKTTLNTGAEVHSIAFSPDGQTLASGGEDRMVKLWDVTTGKVVASLNGHTDLIRFLTFSPDGKILASSGVDKLIIIWDVTRRKEIATLGGHSEVVLALAFSPDGKTLVSGSADKCVKIWDVAGAQLVGTLEESDSVFTVAFSPDGKRLATGSTDRTIKLWDVASRKNVGVLKGHDALVASVAFSADGTSLVSGSVDNAVMVWDLQTGKNSILGRHADIVRFVVFSRDGKQLATVGGDLEAPGEIRLWDTAKGTCAAAYHGHFNAIFSAAFSPNGETLATASLDKTIKLWKLPSNPNGMK